MSGIKQKLQEKTLILEVDSSYVVYELSNLIVSIILISGISYCVFKSTLGLVILHQLLNDLVDHNLRTN